MLKKDVSEKIKLTTLYGIFISGLETKSHKSEEEMGSILTSTHVLRAAMDHFNKQSPGRLFDNIKTKYNVHSKLEKVFLGYLQKLNQLEGEMEKDGNGDIKNNEINYKTIEAVTNQIIINIKQQLDKEHFWEQAPSFQQLSEVEKEKITKELACSIIFSHTNKSIEAISKPFANKNKKLHEKYKRQVKKTDDSHKKNELTVEYNTSANPIEKERKAAINETKFIYSRATRIIRLGLEDALQETVMMQEAQYLDKAKNAEESTAKIKVKIGTREPNETWQRPDNHHPKITPSSPLFASKRHHVSEEKQSTPKSSPKIWRVSTPNKCSDTNEKEKEPNPSFNDSPTIGRKG